MMTHSDDPRDDVQAQAAMWLVHLRSGQVTPAELDAFRQWCTAHPQTAATLRQMWSGLRPAGVRVAAQEAAAARAAADDTRRRTALRPGRRAFVGFAVAAGASWFALRPPFQLWPALTDLAADYRTGTGEQRQITVAEGVTVAMGAQTRIDALRASAGSAAKRGIDLLAGEAEIVAEPAARGFVVVAGRGRMRATQARFDVRRGDDGRVCVTCVSGSVALEHPHTRLTLSPAQQLVYDDRIVHPVATVDPAAVVAWRRGMLVFDGVPLAQVIDEINRYRRGRVILRNTSLGQTRVAAQAPVSRLDALIDTLGHAYGARITRLPGGIVVLT
ncbi:FecR domain-containing protein [Burkholderia pseudomultivorans]|uniref:FecR family protein n=1 Tax=Burkholderia pseudomultivorans TaxID=1207504 RepID=UPI0007595D4A|nr:FecR domain-containing protein [Burkholderia pseudomultivorans]KVC21388.1 iron dicitrate transport regulator FecR [Burkholderia pseudomultivorans]KVC33410.1 iron dicitrate transport regulator FecR [Burkholderia pseudomultivorans]KVC36177.1 iron dicitrate transport regulator FecR [Burkholderia pseudomultivorans]MDS0791899.1 FecR domain-containing protein [Burkholderia pseudomultivorans]